MLRPTLSPVVQADSSSARERPQSSLGSFSATPASTGSVWEDGGKSQVLSLALAYLNLGRTATLWFSYPFAKGTAMNLVASKVLTCMSTLGRPLASACTSA